MPAVLIVGLACGCGSPREKEINKIVIEAVTTANERAAQVPLVQTDSDDFEPLTPMTRLLITDVGVSVDNTTTIEHWWRTGPRLESTALASWTLEELIIDKPDHAPLKKWRFSKWHMRHGQDVLYIQPLANPMRWSNTIESRISRDMGKSWSSGDLGIWVVPDAPYHVIAAATYMASQNGYHNIYMALESSGAVVGLPLALPRFTAKHPEKCTVTMTVDSPPGPVGKDCKKALVKADESIAWKKVAPVLESILAGGVDALSLYPLEPPDGE